MVEAGEGAWLADAYQEAVQREVTELESLVCALRGTMTAILPCTPCTQRCCGSTETVAPAAAAHLDYRIRPVQPRVRELLLPQGLYTQPSEGWDAEGNVAKA